MKFKSVRQFCGEDSFVPLNSNPTAIAHYLITVPYNDDFTVKFNKQRQIIPLIQPERSLRIMC